MWESEGRFHCDALVVCRVADEFGGFSNMSNSFPVRVAGVRVGSSEALYQACRYPGQPEWQREILEAPHAMRAKMAAKKSKRREESRPDWSEVRVHVMRWVLRVKLAHHLVRFGGLLRHSGERVIVERSRSDRFWGAVPGKDGVLRGENWLGRLLMELRGEFVSGCMRDEEDAFRRVSPPAIPNFCLCERNIAEVCCPQHEFYQGFLMRRRGRWPEAGAQLAV